MLLLFPLLHFKHSLSVIVAPSSHHISNPHILPGICPDLASLQIPVLSSALLCPLLVVLLESTCYSVTISFPLIASSLPFTFQSLPQLP